MKKTWSGWVTGANGNRYWEERFASDTWKPRPTASEHGTNQLLKQVPEHLSLDAKYVNPPNKQECRFCRRFMSCMAIHGEVNVRPEQTNCVDKRGFERKRL